MKLDINSAGRVVIRDVTPEAWAYIGERRKNRMWLPGDDWGHWCFSEELYEGAIYVTLEPEKFKSEITEIIDELASKYGLEMTEAAKHVFIAWCREAHCERQFGWHMEALERTDARIGALERLAKRGCGKWCEHFHAEQSGDDLNGYCGQGENAEKLVSVPVRRVPDYQGYLHDIVPGSRFYPCEECKYFKDE